MREAEELTPGPVPRPGPLAPILPRTERRDRPDGPLSPDRGPVRLERSGQPVRGGSGQPGCRVPGSLGCGEGSGSSLPLLLTRQESRVRGEGAPPGAAGTMRPTRGRSGGGRGVRRERSGWGHLWGGGGGRHLRFASGKVASGVRGVCFGRGFGKRMALSGGGRKQARENFPRSSFGERVEELCSP